MPEPVIFIQDEHTALKVCDRMRREIVAFDTETTGLLVRSGEQDLGRTIQFACRPWDGAAVFEMTDRWRPFILNILLDADELIAHNLKFDLHVVHSYLELNLYQEFEPEELHDTVWVARLFDERDGARLKPLATKHLHADAAATQGSLKRLMTQNGWTWATVPIEHLIAYGGNDAIITGQLFDLLFPRIEYALDAYRREQYLNPVLYEMERTGLLIDREMLEAVANEEKAEQERWLLQVRTLYPGLNPNAPLQVRAAFGERGNEIPNATADTLRALYAEKGDKLAHAILMFRKHAKVYGTYAKPWLEVLTSESRIHPSIKSLGAKTGRTSSEQPNFQNIPRGHRLRDIVIAAPGHKLIVADWNQMELRLYAHFAKDENMRAAFLAGADIYQQVADLLGVDRQVGKMLMLASIYGAGPKTIKRQAINMAYRLGMDEFVPALQALDWQDLYDRFHAKYRIKDLARMTELAARRRGMLGEAYIVTVGGRRQRPKRIKLPPVNGYRQTVEIHKDLANSLVQGSCADLMKQALIDAADAGLLRYMRLTVHDEMVLEVPDEEVAGVAGTLKNLMTRTEFVPTLTVEADSASRYGEAK